jgi:BirA family transcriptional regulator, biotin operon repressor / biotin---[acetyl-CoA-carboxylase] ligase
VDSFIPYRITQNYAVLIGRTVYYYDTVTSTNEIAIDLAKNQAPEGTVVIAATQTAGRGRLKRAWLTPEGSLAVSIVLRPELKSLPYLIMSSSLAVVRTISALAGIPAGIKWPNDIQIKGRKVCGILIENSLKGSAVEYSVVGIGININLEIAAHPEIAAFASSLYAETGKIFAMADFTQRLLVELENQYLAGPAVFEPWKSGLVTIGRTVRAVSGKDIYTGVAEDVDRDGCLLLRLPDSSLLKFAAGDVTLAGSKPL